MADTIDEMNEFSVDDLSRLLPSVMEESGPSYRAIKQALLSQIGLVWKVGDRLPSIKDIASAMSVSPNSVQLAVRELVEERVLSSRRRVGLHVLALPQNAVDRVATGGVSRPLEGRTIGLVVSCDPIQPFIQRMISGFRKAVEPMGAVITRTLTCLEQEQLPAVQSDWGTVLFNPSGNMVVPDGYENLTVVTTAEHVLPDLTDRADRVGVDQYQGGMLAGSLLRKAGCQHVCFAGRRITQGAHRYDLTSALRLNGFEQTWGHHLESHNQIYLPGYSINSGAKAFGHFMAMSPRPQGVFAASDELAVGFMAAATAAGMQASVDYQLVGFDGQDERGYAGDVPLTTVRVPAMHLGQVAAQMMLLREADSSRCMQHVAIPCSMIAGGTARLVDHA